MPPPRALKINDTVFCLLREQGRHDYEIVTKCDDFASALDLGIDWLSDPDQDHGDEFLLVEVKVLKRLRRKPRKADVEVT